MTAQPSEPASSSQQALLARAAQEFGVDYEFMTAPDQVCDALSRIAGEGGMLETCGSVREGRTFPGID